MKRFLFFFIIIISVFSCKRNVDYIAEFNQISNEFNKNSLAIINDRTISRDKQDAAIDSLWNETQSNLYEIGMSCIEHHKDDSLAVMMLITMYNWAIIDGEQALGIIKELGPNAGSAPEVITLKNGIDSVGATSEGNKFVDFSIAQPDGKVKSLSDYAGNGKYCLVDMWASWCGPCKAQIPFLREAYEKFSSKGLNVVSVAVWDDANATIAAAKEHNIVWNQIIDAQHVPTDLYGVTGIPQIMLIGPDGTILKRDLVNEAIIDELEKYF